MDATFSALAHPIRRAIVGRLREGELAIKDLAEPFAVSLPAILKHVSVLEKAGLLSRHKLGRINYCRLAAGPLEDAAAWLAAYERFWGGRLDELETFLHDFVPGENESDGPTGQDNAKA